MWTLREVIIGNLVLVACAGLSSAYNYCSGSIAKELCPRGGHIVCEPDTVKIGKQLLAYVPITRKIRKLFIDEHNKKRDLLASGEEKNKEGVAFPKATRMRELIWDDELAYIAYIHAGRCNMAHDKCRSTKRFKFAGQNLAWSRGRTDTLKIISDMVNAWYIEKELVEDPPGIVAKLTGDMSPIGHFTALANDQTSRVGCAVTYCEDANYFITCNYEYTNMMKQPMYRTGQASTSHCSDWGTGPSSTYKNLCENSGKVFPPHLVF